MNHVTKRPRMYRLSQCLFVVSIVALLSRIYRPSPKVLILLHTNNKCAYQPAQYVLFYSLSTGYRIQNCFLQIMMQASSTALRDRRAVSNVSADTRSYALNADPGVRSRPGLILSWRLILKLFLRSFSYLPLIQEWFCQLQAKICV